MNRTEIVRRSVQIIEAARRGDIVSLEDLEWLKEQIDNVLALKSELVMFHLHPKGHEVVDDRVKNFGAAIGMMMADREAEGPSRGLEIEINGYLEKVRRRREQSRVVCGNPAL